MKKRKMFFSKSSMFIGACAAGLWLMPLRVWAQEERLLFLPAVPVFERMAADPTDPHHAIIAFLNKNRFEGNIGAPIEFLQWLPKDGSRWGWGILASSDLLLDSLGHYAYPERVSDWTMGMYFSQSSGPFSHRLEYTHVSSHLGDEFFPDVPRFIYTRESFRWISSFRPADPIRLYAGVGHWGHIDPVERPFFLHAGAELYTNPFEFIVGTSARGYFAYDVKLKDEAGGVMNQAFQLGLRWKWKEETRSAIRLAILYYNGNSEYGQFYRLKDDHWGLGIYFDP